MKLTKRQRMLLYVAIDNLNEVSGIYGVDGFTVGLDYSGTEVDLSALAEDIRTEFDLKEYNWKGIKWKLCTTQTK